MAIGGSILAYNLALPVAIAAIVLAAAVAYFVLFHFSNRLLTTGSVLLLSGLCLGAYLRYEDHSSFDREERAKRLIRKAASAQRAEHDREKAALALDSIPALETEMRRYMAAGDWEAARRSARHIAYFNPNHPTLVSARDTIDAELRAFFDSLSEQTEQRLAAQRKRQPDTTPHAVPPYRVLERSDVSSPSARRYRIAVEVPSALTEAEIRSIAAEILAHQPASNAVALFFYLPGTDQGGHYTAGKADWAPYGSWSRAAEVRVGDYSHHQLTVTAGNALGEYKPSGPSSGVPEAKRKKIFWDIAETQQSGVDATAAYGVVARRHGVPEDDVWEIATEGITKGWPMPWGE